MRPKTGFGLAAALLSIPFVFCVGCAASDKSGAVANSPESGGALSVAFGSVAVDSVKIDAFPLTPCKMLSDASQLSVPASASQQLNSNLSARLGHSSSWRGQWLSWPAPEATATPQDNARVRLWVNDIAVWPDNYLFSVATLDISGFDQAHLAKIAGKEAPTFRRDAASVSATAKTRAEPNSSLLDVCKVYEMGEEALHARWLVNFGRGTSGSSIVVDDFSGTVVAVRPLQYGGP